MERKQIIIPAPTGQLVTTLPPTMMGDNDLALAENIERINDKIQKRTGTASAISTISGTPASIEPRGVYNFTQADGTEIIIVFERGESSALVKKILYAVGGTWTWAFLTADWDGGNDIVMANETEPRYVTYKNKLYFTNGDNTDGLIYWDGSGSAKRVQDESSPSTPRNTVSGKFLLMHKGYMYVANGYFFDTENTPQWSASRLGSAVWYSKIYDVSTGSGLEPYETAAWSHVDISYHTINPDDGGEIVAFWNDSRGIFVGKQTGIWKMIGNNPENMMVEKITDIGMESDNSLQQLPDGKYVFKNKDGFWVFDGRNRPQNISESIKDLTAKIPNFDIGGEADVFNFTLDSNWANITIYDSVESNDVDFLTGNSGVELKKRAPAVKIANESAPYSSDRHINNDRIGFAYSFYMEDSTYVDRFFLTSVHIPLESEQTESGTLTWSIRKCKYNGKLDTQVGNSVETDVADIETGVDTIVDFTDANVTCFPDNKYYVVCEWTKGVITSLRSEFGYDFQSGWRWVNYKDPIEGWVNQEYYRLGHMYIWGNYYFITGNYKTKDDGCDLGAVPTKWGTIKIDDSGHAHPTKIKVEMRNGDGAGSWSGWETLNNGDTPTQTIIGQYVDFKIEFHRVGIVKSPNVTLIKINACVASSEITARLCYSRIFNEKYECATNWNKDGTYRTFVLDRGYNWSIQPDQLIRGYFEYNKEQYLLTMDTNTKIHLSYRGTEPEHYYYDHSTVAQTGSNWYHMKVRSKAIDLRTPGFLSLLENSKMSFESMFAENYVQGIFLYKLDNGTWTTNYFPSEQNANPGNLVVYHIFPAGKRCQFVQFEWRTFVNGTTSYGTPYAFKDMALRYFLQYMPPLRKTTTTIGDVETGSAVE